MLIYVLNKNLLNYKNVNQLSNFLNVFIFYSINLISEAFYIYI